MIVGITGTRSGCTPDQLAALKGALIELAPSELHHGDCVGVDAQAHALALEMGVSVVIHPPVDEEHRAFCEGAFLVLPARTHFARNREIVNACEVLVACPVSQPEPVRGGTRYTADYARKVGKTVAICWPDGTRTWEWQ